MSTENPNRFKVSISNSSVKHVCAGVAHDNLSSILAYKSNFISQKTFSERTSRSPIFRAFMRNTRENLTHHGGGSSFLTTLRPAKKPKRLDRGVNPKALKMTERKPRVSKKNPSVRRKTKIGKKVLIVNVTLTL